MRGPRFLLACLLSGCAAIFSGDAIAESVPQKVAQIIPDQTLGTESSRAIFDVPVNEAAADVIIGGATRGENLFHSFSEFSIDSSERVFFFSPVGIDTILSRITGSDISNINGVLGTAGESSATLILMNPNGVVFGENASLDVQGAFIVSTSNDIQLGEAGLFSASNPESSNLLSVKPSALFFSSLPAGGDIEVTSNDTEISTLQVSNGLPLRLLGRNVLINGSRLIALDGAIEIAAVGENGNISFGDDGGIVMNNQSQRGNIRLENSAVADVRFNVGGEIRLLADDINIVSGSQLLAGVRSRLGVSDAQSRDILIDSTGTVVLSGLGTAIGNLAETNSLGNAGNIRITADRLTVEEGAQLSASTFASGDAGDVVIRASDSVSFDGVSKDGQFGSAALSLSNTGATGASGIVTIDARSLSVTNGSQLNVSTFSSGNAGDIIIRADDAVNFEADEDGSPGGSAFSRASLGSTGSGGNITIRANSLRVANGSQLGSSTFGTSNAGNILIQTRESVVFEG
ncbi:MAG: filamentous hemagglutinin N-terminal domain-containing protein, partial [Cyanobacteria bacterium J06649_4]